MESESESEVLRCVECNVEFVQTQKTRLYCSRSCQIQRNNRIQREKLRADPDYALKRHKKYAEQRGGEATRKCDHCGEEFSTLDRRKRFCSKRCKDNWGNKTPKKKELQKAYKQNNRTHINQYAFEWRRRNPDKSALAFERIREKLPYLALINAAHGRALKKGLKFNLTREWAAAHWTGQCEITGIPFKSERGMHGPQFYSPTIDRIDSKGGYTCDNCRFILHAVNAMKSNGTDNDVLRVAKELINKLSP